MEVKKVLYKMAVWPLILIFTLVECLLKLLVKICTVAAGLMINVLLVCMVISICTQQWTSMGILVMCIGFIVLLVYGHATMFYLISEAREFIKRP